MKKHLCLTTLLILSLLSAIAQSPAPIDVQQYKFSIQLNDQNDEIKGQAEVKVSFLKTNVPFSLDLINKGTDGKGMTVLSVKENNQLIKFKQDSSKIWITPQSKTNGVHTFMISYAGIPSNGLVIAKNMYGKRTFFGDNWPNRAKYWLPCNDHPSDKAPVEFIVTAPDHYQVIANGLKIKESSLANHLKLTHWREEVSLPTKVMVIGVADFAIQQAGTVQGIPVYSYVYPENKDRGFKDYAYAVKIIPFYDKKIGAFPYKKLANVQSKTMFGGMENASAIFYSESSVGQPGVESLFAHEIAHQYFGDAVTENNWKHVWLSEGFATYMTNAYTEDTYGADSLKNAMGQQREKIFAFEKRRLTPVIDSAVTDNFMQLLNANSYEKGAWTLHMLRRKIGDAAFWKGIQSYYKTYSGGNASTDNLQAIMEKASGKDLKVFFDQWLRRAGHPSLSVKWRYDEAKKIVSIQVDQQQELPYSFPLEIAIDGQKQTLAVADKSVTINFPAETKPATFKIDPDMNLLATFELK